MNPIFQKLLTRKYSVLMNDILIRSWLKNASYQELTGIKTEFKNIEILDGAFFLDKNWTEKVYTDCKNKRPKFFWNFSRAGFQRGEKLKFFVRKLSRHKSKAEMEQEFWESLDLLGDLVRFVLLTHPLAKIIEDKVRLILEKKKIGKENFEKDIMELAQPAKINTPLQEQIDLETIKRKVEKRNFNLEKALKEHFEKYSYLGYHEPFSKGFSLNFFRRRLTELKNEKDNSSKLDIEFSKVEEKWIKLMKEFVYFRNYRTEKMCEAFFFLEKLWNRIGKKYKLSSNELAHYRISEVISLFRKGIRVSKNDINARKESHGFLVHDGKIDLLIDEEVRRRIEEYERDVSFDDEIKGSVACKGISRGIARIILMAKKQFRLKKGEILVTSMTTPDYLPAMERALAFVTDEGGITCHAAIVSRELGKPCVIGTKNATKIIKDGDLVEVDANNGTVKIIKKAK